MFTLSALSSHRVSSIPVVFSLSASGHHPVANPKAWRVRHEVRPIPVIYTLSAISLHNNANQKAWRVRHPIGLATDCALPS